MKTCKFTDVLPILFFSIVAFIFLELHETRIEIIFGPLFDGTLLENNFTFIINVGAEKSEDSRSELKLFQTKVAL